MNEIEIKFDSAKISKKNTHMKNNLGGLFSERISYIKADVPIIILFRVLRLGK